MQLTGFDALVHSTIPFGSGLSSSAAIEMATAVAFQLAGDFELDPVEMALLGQRAENTFVGVPCGILDQFSSALGHAGCALLLDCRDLTTRRLCPSPTASAVVICDTRAERNLAGTGYRSPACPVRGGRAHVAGRVSGDRSRYATCRMEQFEAEPATCPKWCQTLSLHHRGEPARAGLGGCAARWRTRTSTGCGLLCADSWPGARPVRDQRAGHGADDGRDAPRARRHRRAAGGSGLRRLHGGAGAGRVRGRVSAARGAGVLSRFRDTGPSSMP